jgi:hypothetical protein
MSILMLTPLIELPRQGSLVQAQAPAHWPFMEKTPRLAYDIQATWRNQSPRK